MGIIEKYSIPLDGIEVIRPEVFVYRTPSVTLYRGDAMKIMQDMKAMADLIVSDVPYELTSGGNGEPAYEGHIRMKGAFDGTKYDNGGNLFEGDIPEWKDFMPLLYDALTDEAHCYVMANNRNVQAMLNEAEAAGFYFHNLLIWDKRSKTPNRWYMKSCEFTGFFSKGKSFRINNCSSEMLCSMPQVDESDHPTEKPVMLMRHYIENSTQPGQVVMDPFMGSGSTGVAAIRAGRRFIGIEKDPKWFSVAVQRIERAQRMMNEETVEMFS